MMEQILDKNLEEIIDERKKIYKKDIIEFSQIGHEFLNGNKTSAEFKAASGGMGVYAQRSGKEFMIRLRILSGVLDLDKFKLIKDFANEYSLEYIHLTTRQAIQLHDLCFDDIITIMDKSLEHNLITRGGGGNYPRNVSLSPLSGVEDKEAFDVTPFAVLLNKYFLSRMNTYKLPRKFKVAFSNSSSDTANATVADLGFLAKKVGDQAYFRVFIGGSLGVNGDISVPYDELVKQEDVLYHVEACISLLVTEGDFVNKGKARMRFIVKRMGKEEFLNCYKRHLEKVREEHKLDFVLSNNYDINFVAETTEKLEEQSGVIVQKQEGLYTVILHPQGGLLKTEYMDRIISFLEKVPQAQVRLSMAESMYIRNLTAHQVKELLVITKEIRKTTRLGQSISCIGTPTCQIGIQGSQSLLKNILSYFEEKRFTEDILPSIHISGCVNSCSRHQVGAIGFQGKKKRVKDGVEDVYALFIGGETSETYTNLANEYGDILADRIPVFLYELALQLKDNHMELDEYVCQKKEAFQFLLDPYLV